ncbi:MAG: class I SAM-dependent methyltransferase [Gemmatimonadales bacterium]|jgi:SAM-dependent methyltransferase|nr:class I SAM-dependent methyltransferase [Gemmatimonadota bacterium]MBT4186044.1 class I SAM-dependent methyltransferase [Gemmatimonadales bacterium]
MKEQEIRPSGLTEEYRRLTDVDALQYFDERDRQWQACVACGGTEVQPEFEKTGFAYVTCKNCGTLFLNPRPAKASFDAFYQDSESARYWAEVFFPAVAEVRREKLFRPRVERLGNLLEEEITGIRHVVDVGAGYGIFLEEWGRRWPDTRLVAVEPSSSLAGVCQTRGLEVVEAVVEEVVDHDGSADLVTCFEVLEHVHDPLAFVQSLVRLLRPGATLVISTLTIDGFDLQVLWDKSVQIHPPHHINFLSKNGLGQLFTRAGLVDIDISTPGELDVDIVRNAMESQPDSSKCRRIVDALAPDEQSAASLQKHLRLHRLSSHAWVMAHRPPATA